MGEAAAAESDFGWAVQVMSTAFSRWGLPAVRPLPGGPRGYLVLAAISLGQHRSQAALAHYLGVDRTAMTYLLDALEEAGLAERRPDPADRRLRQVVITAAGTRALARTRRELGEAEERVLSPLTPEEARVFRGLLETIARGLHERPDPATPGQGS